MTQPVSIRGATLADAPALVDFNRAMARETENKDLPREVISAGVEALLSDARHGFYVVAEADGRLVAGLMVTFEWTDWRNGLFWWIQSVYVSPDYRRRGIYRQLYDFVKHRAAAEGNVRGFRLYVEKDNARAQAVYQTLGMAETHYKMYEEPAR